MARVDTAEIPIVKLRPGTYLAEGTTLLPVSLKQYRGLTEEKDRNVSFHGCWIVGVMIKGDTATLILREKSNG